MYRHKVTSAMQSIRILLDWLHSNSSSERHLFLLRDFKALYPDLSDGALTTLLSRAVSSGCLQRVCRGLYADTKFSSVNGLLLFHAAYYLRSNEFNYISLETALSDGGVISQILIHHITIMSSGRSNIISCGKFGTIEFIHTSRRPADVAGMLVYDASCKLWRASVRLALQDMKRMRRNCDLINWDVANEFI